MFRIAVCDDECTVCSQIESIILENRNLFYEKIEVEVFYSGEELCRFLKNEHTFDMVILDIELKQIDGIEVGRILREDMHNDIVQIVYISSKKGYAMELFKHRPLNFLLKPIEEDELIKTISKSMELVLKENQFYEFNIGKTFYKIPFKQIMYFESDAKKIRIIKADGTTKEYYGKLSELKEELCQKDFVQIHKSYLVNYLFVAEYQYETLLLTNGQKLSISQTYRKEVREYLLKRRTIRR